MNRFIYLFKTNKNSLMHCLNKIIEFGRGAPNDAHAAAAQSGKIVQKRDCGPTMADTALAHESKKTRRGRFSGNKCQSAQGWRHGCPKGRKIADRCVASGRRRLCLGKLKLGHGVTYSA